MKSLAIEMAADSMSLITSILLGDWGGDGHSSRKSGRISSVMHDGLEPGYILLAN